MSEDEVKILRTRLALDKIPVQDCIRNYYFRDSAHGDECTAPSGRIFQHDIYPEHAVEACKFHLEKFLQAAGFKEIKP